MEPKEAYEQNFTSIFRYFYYKNLSTEEAEDQTQETFLRFFRKYQPEHLDELTCRKILYGIAKNLYCDWVKQCIQMPMTELNEDFPIPVEFDDLSTEEAEEVLGNELAELKETIETLNPTLRAVIKLRFLEGLTRKEVAERLQIKEKHVHVYQRRALAALQKATQPAVSP